ncbi:LysM peptidoglycan-binding domain-containing protein [Flavobacterium sp. SM15]|uniref:amino acid ABC transporter substrate-binding protein n=1 Tax=Flavobacterium sp. SM15 TaxID=2908005 RepID=UPI001EDB2E2B|nr:LysM peptidoglycan-binding domain-containing protein [Flavobacterium sp. SM15]MCG2612512.1 LysM peptidoglycan-binding domain-containing protein [Flavobacterium sp. SM15]
MKHFFIGLCSTLLVSVSAYSQAKNYKEHKVTKGETVYSIAKKYSVAPEDIYRLNPDAKNGVNENAVVLVPSNVGQAVKNNLATTVKEAPKPAGKEVKVYHVVEPKETVFSIARKYDVSVESINKNNPDLAKDGLKNGSTIIVFTSKKVEKPATVVKSNVASTPKYHMVEAKETKFGIAKKYGLSVEELETLNPEIKENLEIGQNLRLNKNTPAAAKIQAVVSKPAVQYMDYQVQPKETLYSLTKSSGLSQEQLLAANPELANGVKIGMTIKMPSTSKFNQINPNKVQSDIVKTLNKQEGKELVLLLPFHLDKIESDSTNTVQERLKKDKFLNMTLDFYAGALIAIDSAKTLGLPLTVKILDSEESKNSSAVASLITKNDFSKTDAVIGPFFQNHVETAASLLEKYNTPVISPLSNERGKPYSNLFQAMPNSLDVKRKMFDFMISKGGNIIAIIDPKKGSSKQFITENYPSVKIAEISADKGVPTLENVKSLMDKTKLNYVILESEKTGMVLSTCNILVTASSEYQVQLVTLEKNETLDFEEIPLSKLTRLKLLYPSVSRDNETPEAEIFAKVFKKKNNIFPNRFATRGFDVTFDVILRLFQDGGYKESVNEKASEQIESKFNYANIDGGYYNKGVYLLFYDQDLTLKEAN